MGQLWALLREWAPWACRREQASPQGTSAETLLQWPLKSPPNTPTCLEATWGAAQGERTGEVTPAMGRASSSAHHPKVSLPVCGCLLPADPSQRVSLSLPISSPCQPSAVGKCGSCQAEAGSAHEQSQQCSANLASPPQEMCFGSALTQQGQSFSLIPWDLFLPQERAEGRDEHQSTAVQE